MGTSLGRRLTFAFSVSAYLSFLVAIAGGVVFLSGLVGFPSVDRGPATPGAVALPIDAGLLALFALQHTVMARRGFKKAWTAIVPEAAERSVFVLAASAALLLAFWQWRPVPGVVWTAGPQVAAVLWAVYVLGWLVVVASTFMIDHFDLFGLRQGWLALRGRAYAPPRFQTRLLYSRVRHPLMSGFLIAMWAAPTMTRGHLLFAALSTAYIGVGVWFEERDLIREIPAYAEYRVRAGAFAPRLRRPAGLRSVRDQAVPRPDDARAAQGAE
jgi:methanethiol S-methyltransferase